MYEHVYLTTFQLGNTDSNPSPYVLKLLKGADPISSEWIRANLSARRSQRDAGTINIPPASLIDPFIGVTHLCTTNDDTWLLGETLTPRSLEKRDQKAIISQSLHFPLISMSYNYFIHFKIILSEVLENISRYIHSFTVNWINKFSKYIASFQIKLQLLQFPCLI